MIAPLLGVILEMRSFNFKISRKKLIQRISIFFSWSHIWWIREFRHKTGQNKVVQFVKVESFTGIRGMHALYACDGV